MLIPIPGKGLRRLRAARRLSRAALARKARLHPNTIRRLEAGDARASLVTVAKLAQALDVVAGELLEDS